MEEEAAEIFSQLKDFNKIEKDEPKVEQIVQEIAAETEVASTTIDPPLEESQTSQNESSPEKGELQIVSSEIEDTSTDSQEIISEEQTREEVIDLQSIFSNVPKGYFDGKGNIFC